MLQRNKYGFIVIVSRKADIRIIYFSQWNAKSNGLHADKSLVSWLENIYQPVLIINNAIKF